MDANNPSHRSIGIDEHGSLEGFAAGLIGLQWSISEKSTDTHALTLAILHALFNWPCSASGYQSLSDHSGHPSRGTTDTLGKRNDMLGPPR